MAVIKITKKHIIDEIQAKLILRLGRKISQQETLDICVEYAQNHFDDILSIASTIPILTPDQAEEILAEVEQFKGTPYNPRAKFSSRNDEDIYNTTN
jgi:hypothetical protein